VVSFGDPGTAEVATVSLNPSWREFQSRSGEWLLGGKRRLASLTSMGVQDPRDLDDRQVGQVVAESRAYFSGPNWYKGWFGWLERLLKDSRAGSYLDGSACHLDLVQWATKPAQGDLPPAGWQGLVDEDCEFLRRQLAASSVRVVLVNGASVVAALRQAGLADDFPQDVPGCEAEEDDGHLRVFRAVSDGVLFLGWNRPLAGPLAPGARLRLASWVAAALPQAPAVTQVPAGAASGALRAGRGVGGRGEDGFIAAGTVAGSAAELESLLAGWVRASGRPTIGDAGAFGGAPLITVRAGAGEFVLNRDTKRAAVMIFLEMAARAGGAENLTWHLAPSARGKASRVSYRPDDEPTPGWYAYQRGPRSS
jgi:hypothetical protein